MKLLREYIRELLNESTEFHELDSPLKYSKATNVKRLAYCDSSVTEPPSQRDDYFLEYQEMIRYGSSGKRLKNPRNCLLYTSPSPRDRSVSRMPSSA